MNRIVTDTGFAADDWTDGFVSIEGLNAGGGVCETSGVDITPDTDINAHRACLLKAPMVRVAFSSFADGRGFTIAKSLRLMGYEGRLRAGASLIADQYAMARRAGFDEVEITEALSERQPEDQWLFRADWRAYDHQSRLRG